MVQFWFHCSYSTVQKTLSNLVHSMVLPSMSLTLLEVIRLCFFCPRSLWHLLQLHNNIYNVIFQSKNVICRNFTFLPTWINLIYPRRDEWKVLCFYIKSLFFIYLFAFYPDRSSIYKIDEYCKEQKLSRKNK